MGRIRKRREGDEGKDGMGPHGLVDTMFQILKITCQNAPNLGTGGPGTGILFSSVQ